MEVFETIAPGFGNNEIPVPVWVGQLLQKGVEALHQTVVPGHDILQYQVFFIDADINAIAGQVDFECLGFNHLPVSLITSSFSLRAVPYTKSYQSYPAISRNYGHDRFEMQRGLKNAMGRAAPTGVPQIET
jgi:hypothetical protein